MPMLKCFGMANNNAADLALDGRSRLMRPSSQEVRMALVKCSDCEGPLSTEAVACPHCGRPNRTAAPAPPATQAASTDIPKPPHSIVPQAASIQSTKAASSTRVPRVSPAPSRGVMPDAPPGKKLGTRLLIGIAFLPLIFAWFTLRKGHSLNQRTVAFAWMGLVFMTMLRGKAGNQSTDVPSAPTAMAQPIAQVAAPEGPPSGDKEAMFKLCSGKAQDLAEKIDPATGATSYRCAPRLGDPPKVDRPTGATRPPEVDQLATLYKELMRFKGDPLFKRVGFGTCCKYHDWMDRVERLRDSSSPDIWRQLGMAPTELLLLGLDYLPGKSADPALTRERIAGFEAVLFPRPAKKGFTGKMSTSDKACKSLAVYKRQDDLLAAQDYARATELIETCPLVQKGTPMRGPLDTKKLGEVTYILVEAQGVGKVWVMDDEVDFP